VKTTNGGAPPQDGHRERAIVERDEARRERDDFKVERDDARTERDEGAAHLRKALAEVDVLKSAEELRELFIGVLAHDLSNPLSAIVSTADVMLRRGTLPEIEYKATARISSTASRALRMIDQLLDFTRSRLGGGLPVHRVTTDLARICRTTIDELESKHPDRVLVFEANGACIGDWDPDRLAQLVGNLVANAIQHGEPGAPVRVRLRGEGENVIVHVANQGNPIPPELLPTIFEAFRRRTGDNPSRGLGLGLFIARQIVEAHGGSIDVESVAAARTTTVTVRLPRGGG
jgi:signal transduction histidine kinase